VGVFCLYLFKKKVMWILLIFVLCLLALGLLAIGELITINSPESRFAKFWRNYVVEECQECD
jgi:flagellar basal body-associated protein FliL